MLAGRKPHPWGQSAGVDRGVIDRIKKGTIPKGDVLARIAQVENVRLEWLLTGHGQSYSTAVFIDDEDAAEYIDDMQAQYSLSFHILQGKTKTVIVATMPAELDGTPYTVIEILVGIGPKAIQQATRSTEQTTQTISDTDMQRLIKGEVGTFQLLGDEKTPGILQTAPTAALLAVAETPACHNLNLEDRINHLPSNRREKVEQFIKDQEAAAAADELYIELTQALNNADKERTELLKFLLKRFRQDPDKS